MHSKWNKCFKISYFTPKMCLLYYSTSFVASHIYSNESFCYWIWQLIACWLCGFHGLLICYWLILQWWELIMNSSNKCKVCCNWWMLLFGVHIEIAYPFLIVNQRSVKLLAVNFNQFYGGNLFWCLKVTKSTCSLLGYSFLIVYSVCVF